MLTVRDFIQFECEHAGLMLELYLEQDEYIPELTEAAGVLVTIHDQDVMPFPEDDGILVAPDAQTNIAITLVDSDKLNFIYKSYL